MQQKQHKSTCFSSFLNFYLQIVAELPSNQALYEPAASGVTRQFNMASRKALAPKLYKRFLQVCEQWPVDQQRLGRDLGEHLKGKLVPRIKNSQIDVSILLSQAT